MDEYLFPKSYNYTHAWTTSTSVDLTFVEHVELQNDVLHVHKTSIPPHLSIAPDNHTSAWSAFYPKGGVNPGSDVPSGFGFYLGGPDAFNRALLTATEVGIAFSG